MERSRLQHWILLLFPGFTILLWLLISLFGIGPYPDPIMEDLWWATTVKNLDFTFYKYMIYKCSLHDGRETNVIGQPGILTVVNQPMGDFQGARWQQTYQSFSIILDIVRMLRIT